MNNDYTERLTEGLSRSLEQSSPPPIPVTIGRYEIGPLLGEGGMAEVYRAFDPTLKRAVALKFLRETDRDHLARFLREARAQAQIGHANICDVYEAGVVDGRPFIAMRCIDGVTLAEAALRMSIDEKVAVMVDVAEAVYAAHRTGLVHRDLKPNNIMVEAKPDGGWHPWVLDFGLARDSSMDTMTTIGTIAGTPPYMAPEQARGERSRIDRRTDVYGLGATLFDILGGRPPFVGDSSVAVIMQVVSEEAPSLRTIDPSIPMELDTIVHKCLEKDPQRRYDSARALVEDLRRYLDGEPIQAKRLTFAHRWARHARKHPTIATLLAIAMVAVLASTAWVVATSLRSAEQQRAAQRFGQEIERMEAISRYASMLPLHDVRRERRMIRDRIARVESEAKTMGRTAAGPAQYAIGRGYLALREWEPSRRALEAAWNDDYRTAEVAYALGRVIGAQYQNEVEEAERIANADARAARKKQTEKLYRDPALAWLRQSAEMGSESPAYAVGLIALFEKRYDAALERAREAFRDVPWMHEAKKLEADIWIARGIDQYSSGDIDKAVVSYARAGEAYREAQAIGSSDESVLLGEAAQAFRMMLVAMNRGEDPTESMQRGIEAAERAAVTNANLDQTYITQSQLLQRYGEWQLSQGQSPVAIVDRAIAIARRSVAVAPKNADAHRALGTALFAKARYAHQHGEDPVPLYDASVVSLRQSATLDPRSAQALISLANSIRRKAEAVASKGSNPVALLNESIQYYDRATAADPEWANSFNDRGLAFMTRGEWEMENGIDPIASFAESAKSLERAIAINPKLSVAMMNLGSVHVDRANFLIKRGTDPRGALLQATDVFAAASKLNSKMAFAHSNAGLANLLGAQYALDVGEDPRPWVERGKAAYARALEINPNHANSYAYTGAMNLLAAQHVARIGGDPTALLGEARANVSRGDAIDSESAEFLQFAAAIEVEAARYAIAQRKSAAAPLAAADALIARALKENPSDADTLYTAADLYRLRGDLARAIEAVEKSIAVDPAKSEAYGLCGELLLARGKSKDALAAFDQAVKIKPNARWRWVALREKAVAEFRNKELSK
ncbi:MAG TPA: protein kinase [Thermoanaerobaculia bacterium]|jgi:serine/threonine-protein kinase|nr:protein kinase [Thermoanaerobaculia bacterium]